MEDLTLVPVEEHNKSYEEPIETQEDATSLLREIRDSEQAQAKAANMQLRLTCINTVLLTVIAVAVLIFVFTLIPRITDTLNTANEVLAELETVTQDLVEADLADILKNVDDLVLQSQESMAEALVGVEGALDNIAAIDIPKLNSAIDGLYKVVNPFEALFGKK
ncbi:MAG: hypothetical protein VB100_04330 [Angelakisella sp.]|nr:hypothetical protein [Angelakisella sp.]